MLRKRAGQLDHTFDKSTHHMGNTITHPPASKSYSTYQRLLFSTKDLSDSDSLRSLMSPTALESRIFAIPSNPPSAFRSSSSQKGPQERNWDCTKVGLGMIHSLIHENEPNGEVLLFESPKSKNIIFGPKLKINFPTVPSSIHFYKSLDSSVEPNNPLPGFDEISSCNCLLDSRRNIISSSLSKKISLEHIEANSTPIIGLESCSVIAPNSISTSNGSSHTIPGCSLTPSEMELSEEYTCIVYHGRPTHKITHIFGDSILECHRSEKIDEALQMANHPYTTSSTSTSTCDDLCFDDEFLSLCYTCKKKLEEGKDIYIYRGDRSFCSYECRFEEIWAEKMRKAVRKSSESKQSQYLNQP